MPRVIEVKKTDEEIEMAMETAREAKAIAEQAGTSVNEYMDTLLGLNTTNETEATDAE